MHSDKEEIIKVKNKINVEVLFERVEKTKT